VRPCLTKNKKGGRERRRRKRIEEIEGGWKKKR
jgi:hypothetical protein